MNDETGDFDWVTARNECSMNKMFERLRLGVKQDTERRQQLRKRDPQFGFSHDFAFASKASMFSVAITSSDTRHSVMFELVNNYISVRDDNERELFRATVTLNHERQCVLMVRDQELEEWQFRKKALDILFFETL